MNEQSGKQREDDMPDQLETRKLTWASLIAHWIDFARAAVALPKTEQGKRMRDSVSHVINLQAVWFALREIDEIPEHERALGLDRAQVMIEQHSDALDAVWHDDQTPELIVELILDAHHALREAKEREAK